MNPLAVALAGIVPGLSGSAFSASVATNGFLIVDFETPPAPLFLLAMVYYTNLLVSHRETSIQAKLGGSQAKYSSASSRLAATTAGEIFVVETQNITALHDTN